jgi:branched-chain amino acid transport system permease protein
VGAVLLTLVDALLARWPAVQHFVYGALLLFALYVMPGGVMGVSSTPPGAGWRRAVFRPPTPCRPAWRWAAGGAGELLVVDTVSKAYGGVKPAQDVSFSLQRGHIHALIGPNGAGKTTMINMLSGIVSPSSGSIRFAGRDDEGAAAARGVRTGHGPHLPEPAPVRRAVGAGQRALGRHGRMHNGFWSSLLALPAARREEAAARSHALALLQLVGWSDRAHEAAGSLPYGLQRRVELARALATQPQLLLLDEPAAGLNPQETAALGQLLQRIGQQGVTLLMVEHHMDLVMAISDHVIVLDHGVKIAEGTPAAIQRDPRVIEAYLGRPDTLEAVS